jgi:hypothetical protein
MNWNSEVSEIKQMLENQISRDVYAAAIIEELF